MDWSDGSMVKSTYYSDRGPEFRFKHPVLACNSRFRIDDTHLASSYPDIHINKNNQLL